MRIAVSPQNYISTGYSRISSALRFPNVNPCPRSTPLAQDLPWVARYPVLSSMELGRVSSNGLVTCHGGHNRILNRCSSYTCPSLRECEIDTER